MVPSPPELVIGAPMTAMSPPHGLRVAIIALIVHTVVTTAYWVSYFNTPSPFQQDWYIAYENAFPLADMCIVVLNCTLCVLHLLIPGFRRRALLNALIAVGGMYFLGCMDILFNLENGMYHYILHGTQAQRINMTLELIINVWCIAFPTWLSRWVFANMDWFCEALPALGALPAAQPVHCAVDDSVPLVIEY